MKIASEILGKGKEPVLLLHGWGQSAQALRPLGEALGCQYQLHLLDLPGFGKSAAPSEAWDSSQYANCVLDYLKGQGIERCSIVGHSFGGKVALRLCIEEGSRVNKLVLMASSGLQPRRSGLKKLRMQGIKALRAVTKGWDRLFRTEYFEQRFVPRFASTDYLNAGPMRPTLVKTLREDLEPRLREVKSDTLLLWGDSDTETPAEMAQRFARGIPSAELCLLTGKDHHPYQGGGAQLCAYHIRKFLEGGAP